MDGNVDADARNVEVSMRGYLIQRVYQPTEERPNIVTTPTASGFQLDASLVNVNGDKVMPLHLVKDVKMLLNGYGYALRRSTIWFASKLLRVPTLHLECSRKQPVTSQTQRSWPIRLIKRVFSWQSNSDHKINTKKRMREETCAVDYDEYESETTKGRLAAVQLRASLDALPDKVNKAASSHAFSLLRLQHRDTPADVVVSTKYVQSPTHVCQLTANGYREIDLLTLPHQFVGQAADLDISIQVNGTIGVSVPIDT